MADLTDGQKVMAGYWEGINPNDNEIETNKAVTIDGAEYTKPVAVTPTGDYDAMKKYLKEFKSLCKFDEVLIHGDYNPRNVFAISPDKTWFVDMTDMCFGDRHYDIFFAIWTLQFYFGINKDIQKAKKCEEMFIDAYGRDVFDDNRYNYCKYLVCMYWNEHNDLVHIV